MTADPSTLLQRLRYWQGQALRSRDLNDQARFNALVQAWHNRALHQAYGIHEGLHVALDAATRAVTVQPGMAYDARGQALVLSRQQQFALPPEPIPLAGLALVLSSRELASSEHDVAGACLPGVPPNRMTTQLAWHPANRFDARHGVVLAVVAPGPQLRPAFQPLRVRPLARPRISHGATLSGNTDWRVWQHGERPAPASASVGDVPDVGEVVTPGGILLTEARAISRAPSARATARVLGLEVAVNTAAAGFSGVPCYSAWLEGDLWSPDLLDLFARQREPTFRAVEDSGWRLTDGLLLLQLLQLRFGHVHQPSASGFTYRLWFPQIAKWPQAEVLFEYLLLLTRQGRLAVAWVGMQHDNGNGQVKQKGNPLSFQPQ